jgi:hypothetical protein
MIKPNSNSEGDFLARSDSYSMGKYEINVETSVALRQSDLEDKPKKGQKK